ncbi:MAG: glycosyltransferase [Bacteroidales bacterium]|nr:glycosyltransferase [Bacteroidales bacterium]
MITEHKVLVTIVFPHVTKPATLVCFWMISAGGTTSPWLEVIVVDDASRMMPRKKCAHQGKKALTEGRVIVEVARVPSPKKRALAEGIKHATGDLIITTDADCRVGEEWVSAISYTTPNPGAVFIFPGPVKRAPTPTHSASCRPWSYRSP